MDAQSLERSPADSRAADSLAGIPVDNPADSLVAGSSLAGSRVVNTVAVGKPVVDTAAVAVADTAAADIAVAVLQREWQPREGQRP